MRFPSKATVELLRNRYPVGTRVELVQMDDPQAPPEITKENESEYEGVYLDNVLSSSYTPGSIFKIVTVLSFSIRIPPFFRNVRSLKPPSAHNIRTRYQPILPICLSCLFRH